jgi:hypothetical protein
MANSSAERKLAQARAWQRIGCKSDAVAPPATTASGKSCGSSPFASCAARARCRASDRA